MLRKSFAWTFVFFSIIVLLPAGTARSQPAAAQKQPVYLRILLPVANAELTIEDKPTQQTGTSRIFVSPALEPGSSYTYTFKATWHPNNYTTISRTKAVSFRIGKEVEVDLRKTDDKQPDKMMIRYVPTPPEVVEAMLQLAGVGKDDVVYDLGCGDGRIVIAAAKKFEAKRGVGVDIDPERIKESRANAKKEGVEGQVEFRLGDVLEIADLSEANVVALYMSDDLNLRLRPILQKSLKPGSRIVSHRFIMGDWKPQKTETITGKDGDKYLIHLWKIGEP